MSLTEILCVATMASIVANAALHWWFGNWFARERKVWIASNEQLLAAMRTRTEGKVRSLEDIEIKDVQVPAVNR